MLNAENRLRKNSDFRIIYAKGKSYPHPVTVLYVLHRKEHIATGSRRIGFVVSKKQGGAVVRNRIKRRLREALRKKLPELCPGSYDLIFIGRSKAKTADWAELESAIEQLLRRAKLLLDTEQKNRASQPDVNEGTEPPQSSPLD